MGKSRSTWGPHSEEFGEMEFIENQGEWANEETQVFLAEAHEALSRLNTKTNKRGKLMKRPRRAENWQ